MFNDDDVKIFSPVKKTEKAEPVVLADEVKRQVILGNIQKAKYLGKVIADSFPEAAAKEELLCIAHDCGVEMNRKIKNQAIILSVFTAEYCLNHYMPSSVLSTTAISMLYDTLVADTPELYNDLLASTAFSFYYMNINGDDASEDDIGETFAMLCGDKNSEEYKCYGKTVFASSLETYKNAVDEVNFAD